MIKEFDVLVTDSRYKHSLAAVRALGEAGLRVATCSEGFSPTSFSKFSRKSFRYKKENFIERLIQFLSKNEVGLVLPIGYQSNRLCSEMRTKVDQYSHVVVDDFKKVDKVSDKEKIIPLLKKERILFPKTFVIKNLNQVGKVPRKKGWVIKSVLEETGKKMDYASSSEELEEVLRRRLDLGPQIVQERVSGEGRGFFAFCDNGKILQSFQHKRIRQYPESGGVSSCAESISDGKLELISKKFLNSIKWTGPVMLEFIYDADSKKYYFIEMNPKFWGSLDLSIFCGLNFPIIPFKMIKKEEVVAQKYPMNKRFQWILPEDTLRIKTAENKKEAKKEWRKDFFNKEVGKDISYLFKDPIPTMIRVISTLISYIKKWK